MAIVSSDRPIKRDDLLLEQIDDDFFVYDPLAYRKTSLNWSAAAILQLCNGERTVEQIVSEVARTVGIAAGEIAGDIEEAIRSLGENGLLAGRGRVTRDRARGANGDEAASLPLRVSAPGLGPMRVAQLGDGGVGPRDPITAVQIFGPYNSGTCLMFNFPHHLTAAQTRYHLLGWKHSLPPIYRWSERCPWKPADGGPPEALLRATLVVCMIRSPYFWLLSTARRSYQIRFTGGAETFSERLRSAVSFDGRRYDSLVAVWNAYYRAYRTYLEPAGAAFVRLEDLVEAPIAIVRALGCHVEIRSSGRLEEEVARIAATPAKEHDGPCVAGEEARRLYRADNVRNLISAADLAVINEQIDPSLLEAFGYPIADS